MEHVGFFKLQKEMEKFEKGIMEQFRVFQKKLNKKINNFDSGSNPKAKCSMTFPFFEILKFKNVPYLFENVVSEFQKIQNTYG